MTDNEAQLLRRNLFCSSPICRRERNSCLRIININCVCPGSHGCRRHHLPSCLSSPVCLGQINPQLAASVVFWQVLCPIQFSGDGWVAPSHYSAGAVHGRYRPVYCYLLLGELSLGLAPVIEPSCCRMACVPQVTATLQRSSTTITAPAVPNYSPALARLHHCPPTINSLSTESIGPPSGPAAPIFYSAPDSPPRFVVILLSAVGRDFGGHGNHRLSASVQPPTRRQLSRTNCKIPRHLPVYISSVQSAQCAIFSRITCSCLHQTSEWKTRNATHIFYAGDSLTTNKALLEFMAHLNKTASQLVLYIRGSHDHRLW